MREGKLRPFIEKYYPEYYSLNDYPVDKCAAFKATTDQWGILGNFAHTPLVVNGITFNNSEKLFQLMKFSDEEPVLTIYKSNGLTLKRVAKNRENNGLRRADWGQIVVDCMKFCLQTKYDQNENFRNTLKETGNLYIVEDETNRPGAPDSWGMVREGDKYIGSNLLGRLLMELRDNGKLDYHLPDDIFDFTNLIKSSQ